MKKLLTSLLVFAGIILTPAFASASSIGINDLAYSYFAYSAPYIQNVAAARQQAKALNNGYFGGYGYTPAGYSYYSPYTQNYNYGYSGLVPFVPFNSYGYNNGYNGYSNYYYPNNYSYGYSNPYQSVLGTNNSTYMSFYWVKPITPYQNSTSSSVDVSGLQAQSTTNSSLNKYNYTMPQTNLTPHVSGNYDMYREDTSVQPYSMERESVSPYTMERGSESNYSLEREPFTGQYDMYRDNSGSYSLER